ncbi:MBL fold metallo-hydrolase [Amycolatopsis sp. GM8]|uniref:MBL fold metallo-hydrolase n=1 Tax=Amycolatopsis sp. GM8 TaxID=2896530 RepID=UPI001F1B0E86|nr:MBL fold metallo-hydrolase [Amycolatopsis sp. GM8]
MLLGEITVHSIIDGDITGLPATGFPGRSPEEWQPYQEHLDPRGNLVSQIGSFLVRTGDRLLLVDAGGGVDEHGAPRDDLRDQLGNQFRAKGLTGAAVDAAIDLALTTKMRHGALPDSLAAAGVRPEDITDVILTHLHADHIGWVSAHGKPFFPNAVVRCSAQDLDYFFGPQVDESFTMAVWGSPSARERLAPVLDRIETFDRDQAIAPGVDVELAPGHTPGSSVVVLSSGRERALILGDMVHCPVELQDAEWQCIGDFDPELARRTKEIYLREMEEGASVGAGSHFPGLRFGRLVPGAAGPGWTFVS